MLNPDANFYHKELDHLSLRLQSLRQEFRQHDMISPADRNVLDRVQREKEDLEAKLSEAERTGHWDLFKDKFGSIWNAFIVDLDMLEVRLMDAEMIRQRS